MARSKFEVRAEQELQEKGWMTDYKIRPSGFRNPSNYSVDYFNLFDILAYRDGKLKFVSVKGQGGIPSNHKESVKEFKLPKGIQKEIWQYRKLTADDLDKRKLYLKRLIFHRDHIETIKEEDLL